MSPDEWFGVLALTLCPLAVLVGCWRAATDTRHVHHTPGQEPRP